MGKTIIYFVRHGAVDKPKDTWAGINNLHFGLSKKGKEQIRKVREYLSKHNIKVIYTSPINRAYETTKMISEFFPKAKVIKSKQLFEWKYKWKGETETEIKQSNEFQIYLTNPTKLIGGEKIRDLALRMQNFCKKIIKKHKGKEIICVSHQDPIRALRLKLQNKNLNLLNKTMCDRGSISALYFKGNKLNKIKYIELK